MSISFCTKFCEMVASAESEAGSKGLQDKADDGGEQKDPDEAVAEQMTRLQIHFEVAGVYSGYGDEAGQANEGEEALP